MTLEVLYVFLRTTPLGWAMLLVLGAVLGSFINVVIYRLPREQSLVRPRSRCPHCGQAIAAYDNVPVLSFLLLRGRCRHCRAPISWRYPLVELLAGGLTVAIALGTDSPSLAGVRLAFALALLAVLFIDFDFQIIPDIITLPGVLIGLLLAGLGPRSLTDALLGVLLGGGGLLLIAYSYKAYRKREGLGLGDVKLMAMVGAFLGWQGALATLILGSLAGSVVGVGLLVTGRGGRTTALPFGSFLAPAAWVVLLGGTWLWRSYLALCTP